MRHLGPKHTIVVDLDFTRVCRSHAVDGLPTDIDSLVGSDNESEIADPDEQKDFDRFFDEDDKDGKGKGMWKDTRESIDNEQHEGLVPCGDLKGTPKATLTSKPLRNNDAERLQSTFISCIRDESVKHLEETLKVYEIRARSQIRYTASTGNYLLRRSSTVTTSSPPYSQTLSGIAKSLSVVQFLMNLGDPRTSSSAWCGLLDEVVLRQC
jgi:hypothetical protein